jgi:hypothetical protein
MFLPRVLWQFGVFKFLCPADLLTCARVCHVWREIIAHDKTTWKRFEWKHCESANMYQQYRDLLCASCLSWGDIALIVNFLFAFTKGSITTHAQVRHIWIKDVMWKAKIECQFCSWSDTTVYINPNTDNWESYEVSKRTWIYVKKWCLFEAQRATTIEDACEIFRPCAFYFAKR